jgi:hypothetical protein
MGLGAAVQQTAYNPYVNGPGAGNQGVNPNGTVASGMPPRPPPAPPAAPQYNYAPTPTGAHDNGQTYYVQYNNGGGGQTSDALPTQGYYGSFNDPNSNAPVANQRSNQKWSQIYDPNYQNYTGLSTIAQQYGAQAQQPLNDPRVAAALQQQQGLAGGMSADQTGALGALSASANGQGGSVGMLANAAAGNGPTAADVQQNAGIAQAMRAQLTAAASARGGAYAQSAAQQQASQNAANIQLQGVGQAAQLRAQEQQAAMGQYAQAQGSAQQAYATAANQQYGTQVGAAQSAEQAAAGQQTAAMQYYEGQQQAYEQQGEFAGNLAQAQIANDYGLSGTQLQTGTQQRIANQQMGTQLAGAGIGLGGAILMGLATA